MPIYIGNQKINVSGVSKVYVGSQLVYQPGAVVLDYLDLSGQTTAYNTYDAFSFTGTALAYYTDGSYIDVTADVTVSSPDMTSAGTKTITVTYTDGVDTITATYSITVSKAWRTLYDNSSGKVVLKLVTKTLTKGGVPASISSHAEQIRINYTTSKDSSAYLGCTWSNGGSHAVTDTTSRTKYTRTFTYDQGHDIVYVKYRSNGNGSSGTNYQADGSWYRNGLWTSSVGAQVANSSSWSLTVYKLEEYY